MSVVQGEALTSEEVDKLAGQVRSLEAEVRHLQQALQVPEWIFHTTRFCEDVSENLPITWYRCRLVAHTAANIPTGHYQLEAETKRWILRSQGIRLLLKQQVPSVRINGGMQWALQGITCVTSTKGIAQL